MRVLQVRNAHEGLPRGLQLLEQIGEKRDSRNGPVLVALTPVTTVFEKPLERVVSWPARDGNPFFHLYESIWLLAGRNDLAGLQRYVKNTANYSDDGVTFHGSYGFRWRHNGKPYNDMVDKDQLEIIITRLKEDPTDRRCVLQMWNSEYDLWTNEEAKLVRPKVGKDFPCNTMATFQRGLDGELNLVVFCRSNDIIWGLFGANCVQFSMLLEYMALAIGCPIGTYSQVSVNFHAYHNDVWKQVEKIRPDRVDFIENPYIDKRVHVVPMTGSIEQMDSTIKVLLASADAGVFADKTSITDPWTDVVWRVLKAHHVYSTNSGEDRYELASDVLKEGDQKADWVVAAQEWIERRHTTFRMKQVLQGDVSHL